MDIGPRNCVRVTIDLREIRDWPSFHSVFKAKLGFPNYYGANMDAWVDCMPSVDAPDEGMTSIHVHRSGTLILALESVAEFKTRCPDIFDAFVDCSAFVNFRRIEQRKAPILALSYFA